MEPFFTVGKVGRFTLVEFKITALVNPRELDDIAIALDTVAETQSSGHLLLDCTSIEFISSQSIGLLVALHKKLSKVPSGKLVLCGVNPQLMQLLRITRLDGLLTIVKSRNDAK